MVKARRNRQPRDWSKMTQMRSHGGILTASMKIKVIKLTPESQLLKVEKNEKKLKKQINRLKAEKNVSSTSTERKAWIEAALLKIEHKLAKTTTAKFRLQAQSEHNHGLFEKRRQAEQEAEQIRKENAKKIRTLVSPVKDNGLGDRRPGKGFYVEKVERVGGKRKLRRTWRDG